MYMIAILNSHAFGKSRFDPQLPQPQPEHTAMQIWKIEGTERYVSAHTKAVAKIVFGASKNSLKWVRADELTRLLLDGCTIEVTREPPVIEIVQLTRSVIRIKGAKGLGEFFAPAVLT